MDRKAIVVIYHSADFDGIFCREIARKFLGETAEYIGWNYGDPTPVAKPLKDERRTIYLLDISVGALMGCENLIWIDHHKTAMEQYPESIAGYRIDGVAACRLAWQFFYQGAHDGSRTGLTLPTKPDFIDRRVTEPWAVRLAGEYDIWDKRDPDAELFQHGLRSREIVPDIWNVLLSQPTGPQGQQQGGAALYVASLLDGGRALQYARTNENAGIIQELGFSLPWEGLNFLACNAARYHSHLFTAGLQPGHDACFGFKWNGPARVWEVSLYHAPGKEHHDLSVIAKKYGGGGHKGACGFRTPQLPFLDR